MSYGDSHPLFVDVDGIDGFRSPNHNVARRYFGTTGIVPTISQDAIEHPKPDSSFRIFVQGGSTAAGFPYYYDASLGDVAETLLQSAYPGRDIQVITTAMSAVNSYTLLDQVNAILDHKPDAVLIYAGHNEYYGALGAGSTRSWGSSVRMKRIYLRLRDYRVVQLIQNTVSKLSSTAPVDGERKGTLMARMVAQQSIPLGSDLYHQGLHQFDSNLSRLLTIYRNHDIPVFISTIISNEKDHPPFIGDLLPEQGTPGNEFVRQIDSLFTRGDSLGARSLIEQMIDQDSLSADAHFSLASLLLATDDSLSAGLHFIAARDKDRLRFRAPSAINDIIRTAAADHGAALVPVEKLARDVSPFGIPGDNFFTEHLHPNLAGYRLIGRAFFEAIVESELLGVSSVNPNTLPLAIYPSELDSLLGNLRIEQITASWPFKSVEESTRPIENMTPETVLESLAKRVFLNQTDRLSALNELLVEYQNKGQTTKATDLLVQTANRYRYLESVQRATGAILAATGRSEEAEPYFQMAYRLSPTIESARMLGSIALLQNDEATAIDYLLEAVGMGDDSQQSLFNLALAYYRSGQSESAMASIQSLLSKDPDNQEANRLREAIENQQR